MPPRKKSQSDGVLDSVLDNISKDLGITVATLGAQKYEATKRISTGSISLDIAMGGGWAVGRIHEIYGAEGGGKSTMALLGVAQAQKAGLTAAYIDAEHSIDPAWAKKLGVDTDKMIFAQPDCGEQALNLVEKLVDTGKVGFIVIDSVAALVPQAELDGEVGDHHVGLQARMMGQGLRKITAKAAKADVAVVFINQLRHKIGVMFGNPETTPGGKSLSFYASIRLDTRKISKSDVVDPDTKSTVGHDIKVKVIKNKTYIPFKEAIVPINYFRGIRWEDDIRISGTATGVLTVDGKYLGGDEKIKDVYANPDNAHDGSWVSALGEEIRAKGILA